MTPYRLLCLILIATYILHTLGLSGTRAEFIVDFFSSLLVATLVFVSWSWPTLRMIAALVATLTSICFWLDSVVLPSVLGAVSTSLLSGIEFACVGLILSDVLRNKAVGEDDIFGCVGAYLLTGFGMAGIFSLVESLRPGSFQCSWPFAKTYSSYLYLSFMNLTTLGYGDILPASEFPRALCVLEAAFGQLYVAVVIAHLMGFHLHTRLERKSKDVR